MEKNVFTDDERELFDLLKWTIEFLKTLPIESDAAKEMVEGKILNYEAFSNHVIEFANKRFQFLKGLEEYKKETKFMYQDVACSECNFFTSLKPFGEVKNFLGY